MPVSGHTICSTGGLGGEETQDTGTLWDQALSHAPHVRSHLEGGCGGPHILGEEAKILSKKLKLVPKVFLVPLPASFPVCLSDRKVLLKKLPYTTK